MKTVYVSIGNSDDSLTQQEWADYYAEVTMAVATYNQIVHGQWVSVAFSQWQNACWCFDILNDKIPVIKKKLATLAHKYRQESIAWVQVDETEFIEAEVTV